MDTFQINDIEIEYVYKKIKNLNLSISSQDARVRISAPKGIQLATLQEFAARRMDWIQKHRSRINKNNVLPVLHFHPPRNLVFFGKCYPVNLHQPSKGRTKLEFVNNVFELYCDRHWSPLAFNRLLDDFYRKQLHRSIPVIVESYQTRLGVKINSYGIKKMKTRWGSCNTQKANIWINLELVKKKPACLQYVILHELAHLIVRAHNADFYALMDEHFPAWQEVHKELNGRYLRRVRKKST